MSLAKRPQDMTREELVKLAEENFSSMEGHNPEYDGFAKLSPEYDGYGDSHIDFIGKGAEGSFFNLNQSEPFQIVITNANAAVRSFYLSSGLYYPGLNGVVNTSDFVTIYGNGTYTAAQPLPAGMFPVAGGQFQAYEDALVTRANQGTYSLNISCPNPNQSLLKFLNFTRLNPTFSHIIQATTNQQIAQLSLNIMDGENGVIKDQIQRVIPWRKYGDGDQYNLEFIDLKEEFHMDSTNQILVQVAGSSTLTLNIYLSAAFNSAASLRKRVKKAVHTGKKRSHRK